MTFLPMPAECNLAGIGILVTRAAHQAPTLCRMIASRDGQPLRFPVVEISDPPQVEQVRQQLGRLSDYDIAIFVSPNAVLWGIKLAPEQRLPPTLVLAAVGRRTAQTLAESGYPVDVVPDDTFDSEGLLRTPELKEVAGKRIVIVRGNGGRELLWKELTRRGATVEFIEVYQRLCPKSDPEPLLQRWRDDVQLVTVTSNILLDNLFTLLGERGRELLRQTPLIVISERMRDHARELGCQQIYLARSADEQDLFVAICVWAEHRV